MIFFADVFVVDDLFRSSQQKNLNKNLSDLILEYKILFQKVRS